MNVRQLVFELISDGMIDDACNSGSFACNLIETFEQTHDVYVSDIVFGSGVLTVTIRDGNEERHHHFNVTVQEMQL